MASSSALRHPPPPRRPRALKPKYGPQVPTLTNVHISSTYDALVVLEGVKRGRFQMVQRRLNPEERDDITSGNVYVYEESHGSKHQNGIERWTDGKKWSASRSKENFLFYEENSAGSEDPDTDDGSMPANDDPNVPLTDYLTAGDMPGRLTKMTFSAWVKFPDDPPDTKRKWLLVCYWQKPHVKSLPKAYELEELLDLDIPVRTFFSSRAGKNKQQGLPAAGTPYEDVLRRPADLDALRWRKRQYYLRGGRAPMPVGPGTRPEDDAASFDPRVWGEVVDPVNDESVTDSRFRFHEQHQRSFPHHRTRRDELEDIPITERPPHWRPQTATGNTSPVKQQYPEYEPQQPPHPQSHQQLHQAWPSHPSYRPQYQPAMSSVRNEPPVTGYGRNGAPALPPISPPTSPDSYSAPSYSYGTYSHPPYSYSEAQPSYSHPHPQPPYSHPQPPYPHSPSHLQPPPSYPSYHASQPPLPPHAAQPPHPYHGPLFASRQLPAPEPRAFMYSSRGEDDRRLIDGWDRAMGMRDVEERRVRRMREGPPGVLAS